MTEINRRNILKYGAMGSACGLLSSQLNAAAHMAGPAAMREKLLVVFLRGGKDGLNAFIPDGDPGYASSRSTGAGNTGGSNIAIPSTQSLPITGPVFSTNYVRAHPRLSKLAAMINNQRAAILGRVGNPLGMRSHFTEMAIMETGRQGAPAVLPKEGWGAKLSGLFVGSGLNGVAHAQRPQRLMRSNDPNVLIPAVDRLYRDLGAGPAYAYGVPNYFGGPKQLENLMGTATSGWEGHARQSPLPANWTTAQRVAHKAKRNYVDSDGILKNLTGFNHNGLLFPAASYQNPGHKQFLHQMEEAMFILSNTSSRVSAVDFGGFDTHDDQLNRQDSLFAVLDDALFGVDQLAQADPSTNYMVLVITEFGRTVRSNGSGGTDHAEGSTWFVVGDRLNAKICNMQDPALPVNPTLGALWSPLATVANNAVPVATDFRTVFAEVLIKKFGLSNTNVDLVLQQPPGFALSLGSAPLLTLLDFHV